MATDPTEYVNQEVVVTTIQGDVTGKEGDIVFPDVQLIPNATTKPKLSQTKSLKHLTKIINDSYCVIQDIGHGLNVRI